MNDYDKGHADGLVAGIVIGAALVFASLAIGLWGAL